MFNAFSNTGSLRTDIRDKQAFDGFPSRKNNLLSPNIIGGIQPGIGTLGGIPTTGLMEWFNPSLGITTSSGLVTQWVGSIGSNTLTSSSTGPTYVQNDLTYNGRPYILFNGSNNYMNGGNILNVGTNAQWQGVIVCKYVSVPAFKILISSTGGNVTSPEYRLAEISDSGAHWYTSWYDTSQHALDAVIATNKVTFFSFEINRNSGAFNLSINNAWRVSSVSCSNNTSTNYTGNNWYIGWEQNFGYTNALVFDILFYNTLLSQTDYFTLLNYFRQLYNFNT